MVVYTRNPQTNEFELVGPGAATTDTTLSQVGKPADAAAVGNALSNYATKSSLDAKVDKVNGKGLSTNDYTSAEKTKLSGIATGANKTVVDSSLSSTSTNPVQNKVVTTAINNLNTIFSNPNLLINSDFRNPINQRGSTSYSIPSKTYTIDKWKVLSDSATLSVNNGYIKLSGNSSTPSYFIQNIENVPVNDYITVTINVKSVSGILNVYIASGTKEECFSITSSGVKTYTTSVKFEDFMQLNIEATNGAAFELYWAKVEQGSVSTPFVSRLYAEELALCQRYYEKRMLMFIPLSGTTPSTYYIAVNGGQHFVRKRSIPNATASTMYNQNGADSGASIKAFTQTTDSLRMIQLNESCSNYALRTTIEFDAEIY